MEAPYFPLPVPDLEFDPESLIRTPTEVTEKSIARYTEGVKAIVDSIDVPVGLTPKEAV